MRGGQQQGNNQSNSTDFLWIVAGLVIGLGLLWYNQHAVISSFMVSLKVIQLRWLGFFFEYFDDALKFLHIPTLSQEHIQHLTNVLLRADTQSMTFRALTSLLALAGIYVGYLAMFVGFCMVIFLAFYHVSSRYCYIFTMEKFREIERDNWVYIAPVVKSRLVKEDINKGAWAMSMPPLEFVKRYGIGYLEQVGNEQEIKINEGKAHRVFCSQMGGLWSGLESLPPHAQALFAIFAAKGNDASDQGDKLLKQIAASSARGEGLDYSGTRELLVKHVPDNNAIGRAVSPHAYVMTVMASMLELARTSGVVATAEFLWLKKVDRPLWYMLNTVGRQTPFLEVAGPYAHWLVEKRLRRPLKVPVVSEAIEALSYAVSQIKYNQESMGDV